MTNPKLSTQYKQAAAAAKTRELYLTAWRKGFEEPLTLRFKDQKTANSFRMRLYVAIRPYREEPDSTPLSQADEAVEKWQTHVELFRIIGQTEAVSKAMPDGSGVVIVRKVEHNLELADIAAQMGLDWGFEAEALASQQRILEQLKITTAPGTKVHVEGLEDDGTLSFEEGLSLYDED